MVLTNYMYGNGLLALNFRTATGSTVRRDTLMTHVHRTFPYGFLDNRVWHLQLLLFFSFLYLAGCWVWGRKAV